MKTMNKISLCVCFLSLKNIHSMQYSRNDILLEFLALGYIFILPKLLYIANENICWRVEVEYTNVVVFLHNGL